MSSETFLANVTRLSTQNMPLGDLIGAAEAVKAEGDISQSAQLYTLWIAMNPQDPLLHAAHFNHAVLLSDMGQLQEAIKALETAIELKEDFYPAYINLGTNLERSGRAGDAIVTWTKMANKLGMVNGQTVQHRLTAMKQIGRVMETNRLAANAEQVLKQSLDINPNQQDVLQHYTALRLQQCEWPVVAPWEAVDRKTLLKGTGPLSMAIYTDDPMLQLAAGWHYGKNFIGWPEEDMGEAMEAARAARGKSKDGRLKIGYISSDLRNHAVGFIMAELFELHDKNKIEVFAYYCGIAAEDDLKARIRNKVEHWCDLRDMTDQQAAQKIIDDGIDILVDVNGYTKDARTKIFALRPAPVIVNWLGFPGTMATPYHHYVISDEWIIPPENEKFFSEKVKRLQCYQPNDRKRVVAEHKPTRAEVGLPETGTVFCSFNGSQKISRFTFERWLEILRRVPDSVLWLLDGADGTGDRLREYAQAHGVAKERLIFAEKKPNPEHLARYPLADLFLDNLPYGAHVTASDALWMGVPILTLSGRGFAARVCGSLVRSAGLPEMVCDSEEQFIARAVELANDKKQLAALKKKLADNRDSCVLFDTPKLVRDLEGLYAEMLEEYEQGNVPVPDMTNIELYHDIGCTHDHDAEEMMKKADYIDFYRSAMAKKHRYAPLNADSRLWTNDDIAALEAKRGKRASAEVHPIQAARKGKR